MAEEPVRQYSSTELSDTVESARTYAKDDEVPHDVRMVLRHHLDNLDAAVQQLRVVIGMED